MKHYTRRTPAQWNSLVSEQQSSGLSAPQFCKLNDIAYASFSKWKKQLVNNKVNKSDALPTFIELERDLETAVQQPWAVELDLGSGMVLRIAQP